jgi:hypothetical protein
VELQQAIAFGGADIKGTGVPIGARIKFEMWHEKEEGGFASKGLGQNCWPKKRA